MTPSMRGTYFFADPRTEGAASALVWFGDLEEDRYLGTDHLIEIGPQ
jgi:hypothetical protein